MLQLDLHIHSERSVDGCMTNAQIVRRAENRCLDGISVTDHDVFDTTAVNDLRERTDLLVIPGQEISTNEGHVLGYFLEERVEPWTSARQAVRAIHDQGGVAVAAHPYRAQKSVEESYFKMFDAIEVFNARSGNPSVRRTPNARSKKLRERLSMPGTGGSDAHLPWTVGNAVTLFNTERTIESVREGLREGHTRARGIHSLNVNTILSQLVYLWKDPELRKGIKFPLQALRWVGQDIRENVLSMFAS